MRFGEQDAEAPIFQIADVGLVAGMSLRVRSEARRADGGDLQTFSRLFPS